MRIAISISPMAFFRLKKNATREKKMLRKTEKNTLFALKKKPKQMLKILRRFASQAF